eukprot:2850785-Lingulodinium_polyedra.AAC.1
MGGHGRPWEAMGVHGRPWESMGVHGSPWEALGVHGRPWESMGVHGRPWECMGVHGRPWESMGGLGSPWEAMGGQNPRPQSKKTAQEPNLASTEETYRVETGLLHMISGEAAVAPAVQRLLACMSSEARYCSPEASLQKLNNLKASASWRLAPVKCQSLLGWTLSL